jgi:hypothetical protein
MMGDRPIATRRCAGPISRRSAYPLCVRSQARPLLLSVAVALSGCSGPVDLTVVNPCSVGFRIQTFDGTRDAAGAWRPDDVPIADFRVGAKSRHKEEDALMFVTVPEEIRVVEPVLQSFVISITDDLGPRNTWTIPDTLCTSAG